MNYWRVYGRLSKAALIQTIIQLNEKLEEYKLEEGE